MRLMMLMKTLEGLGQHPAADDSWGGALGQEEPAAKLSSAMFFTYIGISAALVLMAGLMSGLTIGLMALDDMEMEVRACMRVRAVSAALLPYARGPFKWGCSDCGGRV